MARSRPLTMPNETSGCSAPQAAALIAGQSYHTMADIAGTEADEAHHFEPHFDQHIYFAKSANPSDQLKQFSPSVTCEHFKGGGEHK